MSYEIHATMKTGEPVVIVHDDKGRVGDVYRTEYTFNGQTVTVDVPASTPEVEYGARWVPEMAALGEAGVDTSKEMMCVDGDERWPVPTMR